VRVAAVDVGTNTVLLLVAERVDGKLRAVVERAEITRLGKGVDKSGALDGDAIERTLAVLARYGEEARALGVERAGAVGTQALREAKNGGEFLQRARAALGFAVEVIGGEREAELSWGAVAASFPLAPGRTRAVVDIGGGSTEIDFGGARLERAISLPIGSVRLTERLLHHDPPSDDERAALAAAVDDALARAPSPEADELVGVAGTVTTLCAISLGLVDYDGARVHGARLARDEVERIVDRLGQTPLADRRRTPGLDPARADVIYAGGVILARLLARARAESLTVSDRGIRWGLAEELA